MDLAERALTTIALQAWGGRATDAHHDQPYWPIAESDTITAWIPFRGSTLANGAMGYLPGSHRVGLRKFQNIFRVDDDREFLASPEIANIEPVLVEVPRGSVAFHSGLTVHTRGSANFHFSVDRDAIPVGAIIAGPCTPIIWPRADGDLPAPPPPVPDALRSLAPAGLFPT